MPCSEGAGRLRGQGPHLDHTKTNPTSRLTRRAGELTALEESVEKSSADEASEMEMWVLTRKLADRLAIQRSFICFGIRSFFSR